MIITRCVLLACAVLVGNGASSMLAPQPGVRALVSGLPVTIRDSAGIRIVEYPTLGPPVPWFLASPSPFAATGSAVAKPAFLLESVPFLDVGGADANVELKDPYFSVAIALSSGKWVLSDRDRLVWLDRQGRVIRVSGRAGRGPAEFSQIQSICVTAADTVIAIDVLGSATLWNEQGAHISTRPEKDPVLSFSCDGRGHVIAVTRPRFVRIDSDGLERQSEHWLVLPSGVRVASLGPLPAVAMAGTIFWQPALAWTGDELVVAHGRKFEIEWRRRDRSVRQIVRFMRVAEKISDADWKKVSTSAVPSGSGADNRTRVLQLMGSRPNASFPAHGPMLLDPTRRVWVADYQNPAKWTVFSYRGELLGRVELQSGLGRQPRAIVGVGADYVQVREVDEDGFTHLRFYRLRPSP